MLEEEDELPAGGARDDDEDDEDEGAVGNAFGVGADEGTEEIDGVVTGSGVVAALSQGIKELEDPVCTVRPDDAE